VHNKIEHRNIVAYGGFKKSISGYTRNRMQNPTIKSVRTSDLPRARYVSRRLVLPDLIILIILLVQITNDKVHHYANVPLSCYVLPY
jgi:hypothetical protein